MRPLVPLLLLGAASAQEISVGAGDATRLNDSDLLDQQMAEWRAQNPDIAQQMAHWSSGAGAPGRLMGGAGGMMGPGGPPGGMMGPGGPPAGMMGPGGMMGGRGMMGGGTDSFGFGGHPGTSGSVSLTGGAWVSRYASPPSESSAFLVPTPGWLPPGLM